MKASSPTLLIAAVVVCLAGCGSGNSAGFADSARDADATEPPPGERDADAGHAVDDDAAAGDSGAGDAAPPSQDPFSPASCAGLTITKPEAVARIGAGKSLTVVGPPKKLMMRKRTCTTVTGCSPWGLTTRASGSFYMSVGGNDNQYLQREYDVALVFTVSPSQTDVDVVIEDVSNRIHCPACSAAGIVFDRTTSQLKADSLGYSNLYIYYSQFTNTADGYVVHETGQSVQLGVTSKSSMTVTNSCARASILSKDEQTEYAVLFQY